MSRGVSSLSDADLLAALRAAGGPASTGNPAAGVGPGSAPIAAGGDPGALVVRVRPNNSPRPVSDAPAPAPQPSTADVRSLSDDDLMRQLRAASAPASFAKRFAGDGSAPATMAREADTSATPLGRELRQAADERLIGEPSTGNTALTALSQFGNTVGLNLPRNAAAGIATAAGALGVPGYSPRSFDENYQRLKDTDAALDRQNPGASWTGFGAGLGAGAVTLPGLSGAATLPARIAQGVFTGGLYSAGGEFADSKDPERAGIAGLVGGAAGGALTGTVEKVAGRLLARRASYRDAAGNLTPEAVGALGEAGIDPAQLPADLDARLAQAFRDKGVSVPAIREAQAAEFDIPLSRGQATGDPRALARETGALAGTTGASAQRAGQTFVARQGAAIDAAGDTLGEMAARGGPRVENATAAGEMIADRARLASERVTSDAIAAERSAADTLQGVRPPTALDALDAGAAASQGVREAAARSRDAYRGAYADVAAAPGTFQPGALDRVGASVRGRLGPETPIDPVLTPAATRSLADLDAIPTLLGSDGGSGPDLRGLDAVRKRLVSYYASTRTNPTDRASTGAILRAFDDHLEDALSAGLFFGDERALARLREARALFAEHQRTFRPQGAGDDVGRAMQRIVERDAQPQEVANFLYGSSRVGNTGLSTRLAERMRDVLGADSPHWAAVQQGLIARVIDGRGPVDVGARLDHLLRGDGRLLAERVLTSEQRAALGAYRGGVTRAQAARTSLPEWVSDLSRSGFDPNQVVSGLFGSGVPGARVGATNFARALKGFLGEGSDEWSGLRQAAVAKLIGETNNRLPAAKQADRIAAFVRGEGAGVAKELFTAEERSQLARYGETIRQTVFPSGMEKPNAGRFGVIAGHALDALAASIGFKLGGPQGGAAAYTARLGSKLATSGVEGFRAGRSFSGGTPQVRPEPVTIDGTLAAPAAGLGSRELLPAPR